MRWGLVPFWWSKPLKELKLATFNARAETVTEKPFFREPFKHRRCLIPASGYYEWHEREAASSPTTSPAATVIPSPSRGCGTNGRTRAAGETIKSATMVITEPNDFVRELHDRMPVILEPDQFEPWLSGQAGRDAQAGGKGRAAAMAGVEAREQLEGAGGRSDFDGGDRVACLIYVRFGALYGLRSDIARRPLCAITGLSNLVLLSIAVEALRMSDGGGKEAATIGYLRPIEFERKPGFA